MDNKEQLAMKILDDAFLQGGRIAEHLDSIQYHADPNKQNKLRKEAILFLVHKGYALYQSQGLYMTTPSGMQLAKDRRKRHQ